MEKERETPAHTPVTIIIPAYNEEQGVGGVIDEIREKFVRASGRKDKDVEIIVIDDGSTDRTAERARAAGVHVLSHPGNLGYGASIKSALRIASHEVIIMTDADGTYPAEYMQPLLVELEECDMAVGQRSGERVHIPWTRRPAKWVLRQMAVYLAEKPIPDLNSGLRAFRKADALRFLGLYPSGFSFTTTITLAFLSSDMLVRYVPINYNPRLGQSKLRPLRDTKNLIVTILRCTLLFNPLRVCVPVSTALFVAALYMLVFVRDSHGNLMDGTLSVLVLSAVQVMLVGFMADIMARMR